MWEQQGLGQLSNARLLADLRALVQRQNQVTSDLLAHLAEVDARRLHLGLGFPSLFAYCVESLGFSESAAGRRIAVARVCRKFPQVFGLLSNGDLHLSAVDALAPHLTPENADELFLACRHQPRRKIDELLAARFPKPDIADTIRRLPLTTTPSGTPNSAPGNRKHQLEPLSLERYGVHFTASAALCDKIDHARALARHRLPNGELSALFELAIDALIRDLERSRFSVGRKPRAQRRERLDEEQARGEPTARSQRDEARAQRNDMRAESAALPPGGSTRRGSDSRHIPAAIAREVYVRDGGVCTFVSPDGRRCAAQGFIEFDHLDPWACGGNATADNLRLLCRPHNQDRARARFGAKKKKAEERAA